MAQAKQSKLNREESGQTLALVALLMLGMVSIMALVLDGGNLYLHRRRMQNAADAAALAAVHELALNRSAAVAQASGLDYCLTRNGADRCDVDIGTKVVTARACADVEMTFARVLGLLSEEICAVAEATYGSPSKMAHMAPIAVKWFPFNYTTIYNLWDSDKDYDPLSGTIAGSYRGWLSLDCVYPESCSAVGASVLKDWMRHGYDGDTSIDTWVRGDNGTKASVIAEATVGQILFFPVFDTIQDKYNNKAYYHIVTFAAFEVTAVHKSGNPKGISGRFKYYVVPGDFGGTVDGGVRSIGLTR